MVIRPLHFAAYDRVGKPLKMRYFTTFNMTAFSTSACILSSCFMYFETKTLSLVVTCHFFNLMT